MFDETTFNNRHAMTPAEKRFAEFMSDGIAAAIDDPLLPLIAERGRLYKLECEIRDRGEEILHTLPKNVIEEKVSITFAAGFTKPGSFDFRTERDVEIFVEAIRKITWRDRSIPHWDYIVVHLLDDFRAARKVQIEDVLEAAGAAALLREADALVDQAYEMHTKICDTPASSFPALLYQLELLREHLEVPDLLDTIIAGAKRLSAAASAEEKAEPEVIGFGEPEER
jgi:hypothetical protein